MKTERKPVRRMLAAAVTSAGLSFSLSAAALEPMMVGENGYDVSDPLFTVGEDFDGYFPPGILDGLGAYELDDDTVRVLANHELLHFRGYDYEVSDGAGGTFTMKGARVSYFDIDKDSREIVASGLAYERIYDANGNLATDKSFLPEPWAPFFGGPDDSAELLGFSRFCSSALIEPKQFGRGRGLRNRIYFTGEEDGGGFNSVGGAEWALDPKRGEIWQLPDLGRGAWENITELDTGDRRKVAILLADDSSPFDFDDDGEDEAAPLFLYVGTKQRNGDFPARNGLRGGTLYVWVADNGATRPSQFNGNGAKLKGSWVEIDNSPNLAEASENGVTGLDEYGYPTQGTLWLRAKELGAFGFSRPEDVATNPKKNKGHQAVLASTGVDTYDVGPDGNGSDTFGTMYLVNTNFRNMKSRLTILYDGDDDPSRALRSPDNLEWADDGFIYVQEDEAEEDSLNGEPLFGPGAANPNEASIIRLDPRFPNLGGIPFRTAQIDRSVVLDASIANPADAVDVDAGSAGEWESSGIIDVSELFDEDKGTLFLFDVQAHGIEDQDDFNADSRIVDGDLVEGGQLLFLGTDDALEGDDDDDEDDDVDDDDDDDDDDD